MTYNSAYTGPQVDAAARLASIIFDDLAAMLADARDYTAHTAGDVFWTATEGFRYRVAASDATDHHLATAGSVKLYVQPGHDGAWNFDAFNPAGDGATDDHAVLMKAIVASAIFPGGNNWYVRGPTILIPDKTYYMAQTIELKRQITLRGIYEAETYNGGPTFKFPTNTRGVTINRYNTLNGDEEGTPTTAADGTLLENIRLDGTSVSNDPAARNLNACGIRMKASALCRNVTVVNFAGDGFYIYAAVSGEGGAGDSLGNCNLWRLEYCHANTNGRHGLHVRGSDANGGTCIAGSFVQNGEFGVRDHSFLGNTYIGCHTATNGLGTSAGNTGAIRGGSKIRYGGRTYRAKYKSVNVPSGNNDHDPAQTPLYATTTPGTDANVWEDIGAEGGNIETFPTWVAGQPEGTYRLGGGYFLSNNNARSVNLGSYSENDEAGNIYAGLAIMNLGGIQEQNAFGDQVRAANGGDLTGKTVSSFDRTAQRKATIGGGDTFLAMESPTLNTVRLKEDAQGLVLDSLNSSFRKVFYIPTEASSNTMGTSEPKRYIMHMPTFAVGTGTDARRQTNGTAAPTTGAWARGDIVWNRDPVAAGWAGWVCVTAGTPGTWKRFGAIEA